MSERRGKKLNAIKKKSVVAKKQKKCSHFVPREATFAQTGTDNVRSACDGKKMELNKTLSN